MCVCECVVTDVHVHVQGLCVCECSYRRACACAGLMLHMQPVEGENVCLQNDGIFSTTHHHELPAVPTDA